MAHYIGRTMCEKQTNVRMWEILSTSYQKLSRKTKFSQPPLMWPYRPLPCFGHLTRGSDPDVGRLIRLDFIQLDSPGIGLVDVAEGTVELRHKRVVEGGASIIVSFVGQVLNNTFSIHSNLRTQNKAFQLQI